MDLILFDIDGTLIRSMTDDGECYLAALNDVFGFHDVDGDWSRYEYITDAGIFLQVFDERRGRPPTSAETNRFRDHFVGLLADRCAAAALEQIAGAERLLEEIESRGDAVLAFATGCWSRSAALKMRSAGLDFDRWPSATCDDAVARENIIRIAVERAATAEGVCGFDRTVYVGDGIWDVWACRRAGVPFIGVAADITAPKLRGAGVEYLLPDLRDHALFHAYREKVSGGG